jgi:hypothetical protein
MQEAAPFEVQAQIVCLGIAQGPAAMAGHVDERIIEDIGCAYFYMGFFRSKPV